MFGQVFTTLLSYRNTFPTACPKSSWIFQRYLTLNSLIPPTALHIGSFSIVPSSVKGTMVHAILLDRKKPWVIFDTSLSHLTCYTSWFPSQLSPSLHMASYNHVQPCSKGPEAFTWSPFISLGSPSKPIPKFPYAPFQPLPITLE